LSPLRRARPSSGFASPSLVVDGDCGFVGGLSPGAESVFAGRPKSQVRGAHFRLRTTIVRRIEQEFDDDGLFATGEEPIRIDAARCRRAGRRRGRSPPDRIMRSLRRNFEPSVERYDNDLSAHLARINDAKCVQPITLEQVDQRPFILKLRDAATRLSMPYI
jgi:phosphatidylserine/phosphatidylglycerophosphate/cardiolipin synthase-like enzyme